MIWVLIASIFALSLTLVKMSLRVAMIDERLDMREIKLMKNLSRYASRVSVLPGNPRRGPRNVGKSGRLKFPKVSGMGPFTAT
nr:hypothetical protein [Rhodopirellula sp. SM50]